MRRRPLRTLLWTIACLCLLAARTGFAAGYESLLDQGEFYLSRGVTYGADAIRKLEQARDLAPSRATADARWLRGMARAYFLTARFTEAYWLLQELGAADELQAEDAVLLGRILEESGLGRIRLVSAVPVSLGPLELRPAADQRLDLHSRKALDRLQGVLERKLLVAAEGRVLLAPEATYRFAAPPGILYRPAGEVDLEVWAGDEVTLRLVPYEPAPADWTVAAGSRSMDLSWPQFPGGTYRLYRLLDEAQTLVYEGDAPGYVDRGLPIGSAVGYRLEVLDPAGDLATVSEYRGQTLPPVRELAAEAAVGDGLVVEVAWRLGGGAADWLRILRRGDAGDEVVYASEQTGSLGAGVVRDGPFLPQAETRILRYRVEAGTGEQALPTAVTEASAELPQRVSRVIQVAETLDRGAVVVTWETLPREGAAEGYAVFRQRGAGLAAEEVGRVRDPFAREFVYEVEDGLAASSWRHFVVPYVGERYLVDPEWTRTNAEPPGEDFKARFWKGGELPDLALSWDPYPGARVYSVAVGDREVIVREPYLEVSGLQNLLMGSEHRLVVRAVDGAGERPILMELDLRYLHYPRRQGEDERP